MVCVAHFKTGMTLSFRTYRERFLLISVMSLPCEVPTIATEMWCRVFFCIVTDVLVDPLPTFLGKVVPLQAWSGPEGSRKLRFPDFLTVAQYGGKIVSLTHRPPLTPGNTPGTHFCQRLSLSRPQGHYAIRRIMLTEKSNDTIWDRTSDLPICNRET
jgi:hypothetical protein